MNCFGLDRRAVDRYRLLPLSGRDVLLSKNLAYAMITAVQVGPLILAGAYRFGLVVGLAALCGAAAYWLLLVIWGNWVSVRHPAPREFFNFDNREQAGGILSQLYALAVEGALILVALIGYRAGPWILLAVQVILLALCAALYRARLARTGRLFEESAELMRERLAT